MIKPLSYRPREAAIALGICERTLWALTKSGEIPHVRTGKVVLYPVAMLRNWLEQKAVNPPMEKQVEEWE
jgi:excisionase family DNA binding protein